MAKKKSVFGPSNYTKRTPKKRPGRDTKRLNKKSHDVNLMWVNTSSDLDLSYKWTKEFSFKRR